MNAKQREYMSQRVVTQWDTEKQALEKQKKKEPQINSYLMKAFLTDTVQFKDIKYLKDKINERILAGDTRLVETSSWTWSNSAEEGLHAQIKIEVGDLFEIPPEYIAAWEAWKKNNEQIDEKIKLITNYKETILMKINLGSADSLHSLIEEASGLVELSLINDSLMASRAIESGNDTKLLGY